LCVYQCVAFRSINEPRQFHRFVMQRQHSDVRVGSPHTPSTSSLGCGDDSGVLWPSCPSQISGGTIPHSETAPGGALWLAAPVQIAAMRLLEHADMRKPATNKTGVPKDHDGAETKTKKRIHHERLCAGYRKSSRQE
jgi:hypothetical protein